MTTWDDLGLRYGTDKASSHHGYLIAYEQILAGRVVRRLLELGVAGGRSLALWRHLFPSALVVGVDNDDAASVLQAPSQRIVIADVTDAAAMAAVHTLYGPFDVIIDDASHEHDHVRIAFEELYPRLVPGGVYVIEDLEPDDPWVAEFVRRWHARFIACGAALGVPPSGLVVVEKP